MRVIGVLAFSLIGVGAVIAGQAPQPSTSGQTTQPGQPVPGQPSRLPARPMKPGEAPPKGTNFALARGGVIAGHILDDTGDPVAGVQVAAAGGRSTPALNLPRAPW